MRMLRSPLSRARGRVAESGAFREMLASLSCGGGDLDHISGVLRRVDGTMRRDAWLEEFSAASVHLGWKIHRHLGSRDAH